MKIAIMQPYFFPYIGYFQLIAAVDLFIIYDNIKYTKKGWINRNRFLSNGSDRVFSVPLQKDSDSVDVMNRTVARDFDRGKLVNQLREAYRRAPYFQQGFPIVQNAVLAPLDNLFDYVRNSVDEVCRYVGIDTRIVPSSTLGVDPTLRAQAKVLALCSTVGATTYVNAIGGQELYARETFAAEGVALKFLKPLDVEYRQFGNPHVPWLSIVDVMMFNSAATIRELVETRYELI
jgi:WbqC-like protein family